MNKILSTLILILSIAVCSKALSQTEYAKPGDVHKEMDKWEGEWNMEITSWPAPGAPAQKSTASCTSKMMLGGRYLASTHTAKFGDVQYEGFGTLAYDNAKKIFISTWMDNMRTGVMVAEGTWDEFNKTIYFKGKQTDPATGKDIGIREIFKVIDNDTQKMEMYTTAPGGIEVKSMEIVYTRKKK